jgi:hypothetical protein
MGATGVTKYVNQTGQPASKLARDAATAFVRLRGEELYGAHVRNLYEKKEDAEAIDYFKEGLRRGYTAAFLTILSLGEDDNGEQVSGGPFGPGTVGVEAGVEVRQPDIHEP